MLITRMHTGTRFFADVLKKNLNYRNENLDKPGGLFYMNHCQSHLMPYIKAHYETGMYAMVTVDRPDEEIKASWMRRYGHLGSHGRGYESQRELWHDYIKPSSDVILTLDPATRVERLGELASLLGHPLITDWTPIV